MFKKITNFLTEVRFELSKVSWSDRNELLGSTMVVIISTALLSIFIGLADFAVSAIVKILIK